MYISDVFIQGKKNTHKKNKNKTSNNLFVRHTQLHNAWVGNLIQKNIYTPNVTKITNHPYLLTKSFYHNPTKM